MINFRTDLATERRDIYRKANRLEDEIPGVKTEEYEEGENIKTTKVNIIDEQGAKALGKPVGTYVTVDIKNLKIASEEDIEEAANYVKKELLNLINKHIRKTRPYFGCWFRKPTSNARFTRTKSNTRY